MFVRETPDTIQQLYKYKIRDNSYRRIFYIYVHSSLGSFYFISQSTCRKLFIVTVSLHRPHGTQWFCTELHKIIERFDIRISHWNCVCAQCVMSYGSIVNLLVFPCHLDMWLLSCMEQSSWSYRRSIYFACSFAISFVRECCLTATQQFFS